jgi:hypothetical protein
LTSTSCEPVPASPATCQVSISSMSARHQHQRRRRRIAGTLDHGAEERPVAGVDAARERPAAVEPPAAVDLLGAARRIDQRRADDGVGILVPYRVLAVGRKHRQHPVVDGIVGPHPGGRGAGGADYLADVDEQTEVELEPADARRLDDAHQPGAAQVVDGVGVDVAQLFGIGRALAQGRRDLAGARDHFVPRRRRGVGPRHVTLLYASAPK